MELDDLPLLERSNAVNAVRQHRGGWDGCQEGREVLEGGPLVGEEEQAVGEDGTRLAGALQELEDLRVVDTAEEGDAGEQSGQRDALTYAHHLRHLVAQQQRAELAQQPRALVL